MQPDTQHISASPPNQRGEETSLVLAFHSLSDRFTFGISNYSPKRFSKLLAALCDKLPETTLNRMVTTFDDGYAHLLDVLPPLIAKYQFAPVIFMPTAYIGKSNSWDYGGRLRRFNHLRETDIRELHRLGAQFGSHGHQHVDLRRLSDESLKEQLQQSKDSLESITGNNVTQISYPFGRYDERAINIAKEVGFTNGFTMCFPKPTDSRLALGRYPVYACDTAGMVIQKITQGMLYHPLNWFVKTAGALSYGTPLWKRMSGQLLD